MRLIHKLAMYHDRLGVFYDLGTDRLTDRQILGYCSYLDKIDLRAD